MKVVDRYVFRELAVPFLIGTVAVVLMFQANMVIAVFKAYSAQNIPPGALLQIILFLTPGFLNLTLPVGTSLATSLAMSRLVRESELTAMRASGAPILRVIVPAAVFGLMVAALNFYIAERVMPPSDKAARKLQMELGVLGAVPDFRSNVTVNLDKYSANIGVVERSPDGLGMNLYRVLLYERPPGDAIWLWLAEQGTYRAGVWTLRDTQLWIIKKGELSEAKPGKDVVINEPIEINNILSDPSPEGQSLSQLRQTIGEAKRLGRDTTSLETAYHIRFSVPFACLVFAIVGPAFAVWLAPKGGFVGVFLSVVVVMLYYNIHIVCTQVFAPNHWFSPLVAAWFPNLLFVAVGVYALRRLE